MPRRPNPRTTRKFAARAAKPPQQRQEPAPPTGTPTHTTECHRRPIPPTRSRPATTPSQRRAIRPSTPEVHQQRTQTTTRRDRSTAGRPTTNETVGKDSGKRVDERLATTGQDDPSPTRAERTAATSHRQVTDRWKKWARTPLSTARARAVGPSSRPPSHQTEAVPTAQTKRNNDRRKNNYRATRATRA